MFHKRWVTNPLFLNGALLIMALLVYEVQANVSPLSPAPSPSWRAETNQPEAYLEVGAVADFNGDGFEDVAALSRQYTHGENLEGVVLVWYGSASGLGAEGTPANADWMAETNQEAALGATVAAGDVNGDGYADLFFASASYETGLEYSEGAVFAWYGSASGLGTNGTPLNADWVAEANVPNGWLGYALALGDLNGDGYDDLAASSPVFDAGEENEGKIFVWHGAADGLGAHGTPASATWQAESNQANAFLGEALAFGDFNGDGYADLVGVAKGFGNGQASEGAAFVWYGSSTGLGTNGTPTNAAWRAESDQASALLTGVATGDINQDGHDEIVLSSLAYDNGEPEEGAIFLWYGSASGLGNNGTPANAAWHAESNQTGVAQNFTGAIRVAFGRFNGDVYPDLAVGFARYDAGENDEGAVFVWHGSSTGLGAHGTPANAAWMAQSNVTDARFGGSVASGEVDGSGQDALLVGATFFTNAQNAEGGLFLFALSTTEANMASFTCYLPLLVNQ